jgi:hypothetical protein
MNASHTYFKATMENIFIVYLYSTNVCISYAFKFPSLVLIA